jgi:hypothetical protein
MNQVFARELMFVLFVVYYLYIYVLGCYCLSFHINLSTYLTMLPMMTNIPIILVSTVVFYSVIPFCLSYLSIFWL